MRLSGLILRVVMVGCGLLAVLAADAQSLPTAWGDRGDGTFTNPVLPADYSNADAGRAVFTALRYDINRAKGAAPK